MKKLFATGAAVLSVIAMSCTPAYASSGKTSMLLTVYTMNDGSGDPGSEVSIKLDAWYLGCFPPAGTHPEPKKACKVLTEVDGWFEAIQRDERICTKEYVPVTVRAEGTWKGRHIFWSNYYGNRCEAAAATKDVYPI